MVDLRGQRFGRLLVVGFAPRATGESLRWLCRCDCGNEKAVVGGVLRGGASRSCGCLRVEVGRTRGAASKRHGEGSNGKETAEYRTWAAMLSRCENLNHSNFPRYGARGISVCERWHRYEDFLADVGRRPSDGHSLDRIDNAGNYEPGNTRWATKAEQNENRRSYTKDSHLLMLTIDGVTHSLLDWCALHNLGLETAKQRLARGWAPKAAILTPVGGALEDVEP